MNSEAPGPRGAVTAPSPRGAPRAPCEPQASAAEQLSPAERRCGTVSAPRHRKAVAAAWGGTRRGCPSLRGVTVRFSHAAALFPCESQKPGKEPSAIRGGPWGWERRTCARTSQKGPRAAIRMHLPPRRGWQPDASARGPSLEQGTHFRHLMGSSDVTALGADGTLPSGAGGSEPVPRPPSCPAALADRRHPHPWAPPAPASASASPAGCAHGAGAGAWQLRLSV